MYKLISFS